MGLFDTVVIKYPMPEEARGVTEWQTKDLICYMRHYEITPEGRLVLLDPEDEVVPEEERPYFGTPKWESPIWQAYGSVRSVWRPTDTEYHGDLEIGGGGLDYRLRFTEGTLTSITRVVYSYSK